MSKEEFNIYMKCQLEAIKLYINKSKNKNKNFCAMKWIEENAVRFREEWLNAH